MIRFESFEVLMKDRQKMKKVERQKIREIDFPSSNKNENENDEESLTEDNRCKIFYSQGDGEV
jgi:hypothetical protein